jgi:hypothetical protein
MVCAGSIYLTIVSPTIPNMRTGRENRCFLLSFAKPCPLFTLLLPPVTSHTLLRGQGIPWPCSNWPFFFSGFALELKHCSLQALSTSNRFIAGASLLNNASIKKIWH